jgi:site-specific DNA recombinase
VVNEEEAKIVRFIFEEYAYHNQGYRAIANKLNQLGYKTKPGNAFSTIAVKDILNNETYRGRVVWGKYKDWEKYRRSRGKNPDVITADGKFEPIVSEDLWNARIKRMAEATRNPKWNGQGTNTLTGVLRCPECGSAMAASNTTNTLKDGTKKKIRYYSCSVFRAKGSAACHANSIRADEIERLVNQRLLEVVQLTNFGQTVLDEMKIVYKEKKEEIRIGLQAKEADMKKVIKNIEDYQQLIKNDKTLQGVLTNTIEAQKRELERINVEVDELKLEREALIAIPSQEAMQSALELVAASTMQSRGNKHELKALYKTIMESVTFDKRTKTVTVNLKLDNDIVAQLRSALKKGESVEGSPFLSGLVRIPIR